MGLSKKILMMALSLVNAATFWIKPEKNRVTFVSLSQKDLNMDFALLYDALEKEGKYDLHTNLIEFKKNLSGKAKYFFNCLKQLVDFKKSELVILNDNNFVVSNFKPEHLKVLQAWHACGAVKKFGNQIKRQYPIQGYDYVLSSAPYWVKPYAEAFGTDESAIWTTGMPRTDLLLNQAKAEDFLDKHPELKDKKLILYAPTFRGNIIDGLEADSFDINQVLDSLDEDTWILAKFHPLLDKQYLNHPRLIDVSEEDLYTLMKASDLLISDYSSVIFDYSLLDKPMVSYIDDLKTYTDTIGLNMDYLKDFPGPVTQNEKELIKALKDEKTWKKTDHESFRKKYIVHNDGLNTDRVVEKINEVLA